MYVSVKPGAQSAIMQAVRACRERGDDAGAEAALRAHLAVQRRDIEALLAMGDLLARRGDDRGATSFYSVAIRTASESPSVPHDLVAALRQAELFTRQAHVRFAEEMREALSRIGLIGGSVSPRVAQAMKLIFGETPLYVQQPNKFYFPGLEQRPFFERSEFDWVEQLESQTQAIKDELEELLRRDNSFNPFLEADPRSPTPTWALLNNADWSALHLWKGGEEQVENTAQVPVTTGVLAPIPMPHIAGFSPMILFSLLRPGTRIPAHHGLTNTRLICHLPVIVPNDSALRVGGEVRPFVEGRTLIFDDSFEHEAWNESAETRVVLIFEVWRPDISQTEREELTAFFEAAKIGAADDFHIR